MGHLSASFLGPFQATLDGQPVAGFVSNRVRALLAYLAVEVDRPERLQLASPGDMIMRTLHLGDL